MGLELRSRFLAICCIFPASDLRDGATPAPVTRPSDDLAGDGAERGRTPRRTTFAEDGAVGGGAEGRRRRATICTIHPYNKDAR
eukprot:3823349-Pyramimonas_sp.AAC.1